MQTPRKTKFGADVTPRGVLKERSDTVDWQLL